MEANFTLIYVKVLLRKMGKAVLVASSLGDFIQFLSCKELREQHQAFQDQTLGCE